VLLVPESTIDSVSLPVRLPHRYAVYGISISSEIPLRLPESSSADQVEVEVRVAPQSWFCSVVKDAEPGCLDGSWYTCARLHDGSSYARWDGVGEFWVSADGRRIVCRQSSDASEESFHVYLLGRSLSFALVKLGVEPLHATAVVVDGEAIAFLGDSGYGKSSLAASFVSAGHSILTDDLLVLRNISQRFLAYPGPPRVKLFPQMARMVFGSSVDGTPMNTLTRKLILPLNESSTCTDPVPLGAIYSLAPPHSVHSRTKIAFEHLSPKNAFFELVKNTFNYQVLDGPRLQRHFVHLQDVTAGTSIRHLKHPRVLTLLPAVVLAILDDYRHQRSALEA
jgi:hypothetical protein